MAAATLEVALMEDKETVPTCCTLPSTATRCAALPASATACCAVLPELTAPRCAALPTLKCPLRLSLLFHCCMY